MYQEKAPSRCDACAWPFIVWVCFIGLFIYILHCFHESPFMRRLPRGVTRVRVSQSVREGVSK